MEQKLHNQTSFQLTIDIRDFLSELLFHKDTLENNFPMHKQPS